MFRERYNEMKTLLSHFISMMTHGEPEPCGIFLAVLAPKSISGVLVELIRGPLIDEVLGGLPLKCSFHLLFGEIHKM